MDPTKFIGPAPSTNDPLAWIAMLLVLVVVATLVWQLRAAAEERREVAADRAASDARAAAALDATVRAFREEMQAQRAHDAGQTREAHERINDLAGEVRRVADRAA